MAPKKAGIKREAPAKAAPAPKKAKADPAAEGVAAALEQASGLPESCKRMLVASLQHALGTPSDQRHVVQQRLVTMIGEVMEGVEAGLKSALDEERSKLQEDERHGEELRQALSLAEEKQIAAVSESARKADALAEATDTSLAAKGVLQEKLEAQQSGDSAMAKASGRKIALEQALGQHLKAIVDGTVVNPSGNYEQMLPLLQELSLDASLVSALPNVCGKRAADRGAFDTMVLQQLSQTLGEYHLAATKAVEEAQPAADARASAVAAARVSAEEAAARQNEASEALAVSRCAEEVAAGAVRSARDLVAAFESDFAMKAAARDVCSQKLEDFRAFNIGGFETLRDKVAAAPAAGA